MAGTATTRAAASDGDGAIGGRRRTGRLGPAGAAVAVAGIVVNALGYAVPVLGARTLSAADLSALAAILALGAIATVPGLGLQAALAVRWARHGLVANANRATAATLAATVGALLVATPAIVIALHLAPVLPALLIVTTAAVVVASRYLGELQGEQRFGGLAVGIVLLAVARYGGVIVGLAAGAGVTVSLVAGAAVAWLVVPFLALVAWRGRPATAGDGPAVVRPRDIAAAGGATLAMLVVSYADLIVARGLLPAAESGAYAVGAVLTKGALWAPQVVTILALPRLAQGHRRTLVGALLVISTCAAALIGAAAVAGGLAMGLAGGPAYTHLGGYAPAFAAVGGLYSICFLFVNAEIAGRVRWPGAPLWLALAGFAAATQLLPAPSLGQILTCSVATAAVAAAATGAMTAIRARRADRG